MKDGGSAFPVSFSNPGMTLRDYFAAKAMQGLVTNGRVPAEKSAVAKVAYQYADAMLAQRDSETLPGARTNCPRCGLVNEGKDDPVNCSQCGTVWHRVPQRGYGG